MSNKNLGRDVLRDCLVKRIKRQFSEEGGDPVEPSLVIGLFGEWGSGKSYLLKQIEQQFVPTKSADAETPLIVPIYFNPWRFEVEEHLIVPLLLTTQQALVRRQGAETEPGLLKKAANRLELLSVAFASALKFKLGIPGIGSLDLDMDKLRKACNEEQSLRDKADGKSDVFQEFNSLYYDFHNHLKTITGRAGTNPARLNLLFLVDDIDRCLPERAVQMMEAIKLFLEVEGCAFVLALDDEVVERGILHRYRDYLFQSNGGSEPHNGLHLPPITGTEYLEKMIQLPVRLPLPTETQVREFLLDRFAKLFGKPVGADDEEALAVKRTGVTQDEALLKLFVSAIPPVPRKLARAAGLLELLIEVAEARGMRALNRVMLARFVILQLFAPEVYRLGRRDPRMFVAMAEWKREHSDGWLKRQFLAVRLATVNEEIENDASDPANVRLLERVERPLLLLIEAACQSRSGFDPRDVMAGLERDQVEIKDVTRYFHLMDETPAVAEAVQSSATGPDEREAAQIDNFDTLLEEIFSNNVTARITAFDNEALSGRVIDGELFERLLKQLKGLDSKRKTTLLHDDAWLAKLFNHLRSEAAVRFAQEADLLAAKRQQLDQWLEPLKILDEKGLPQALDSLTDYAKITWPGDLQGELAPSFKPIVERLSNLLSDESVNLKLRAQVGDALGDLGDPRRGVALRSDGQPDIDWVAIPAGRFTMGSDENDKDAYDDEKPAHTVELPAYRISRYPITNAQYRPFVEAGGYADERYWAWSEAALAWQSKKERDCPAYWSDAKRSAPTRPVIGVCWYEAQAYARWLDEQLHAIDGEARLDENQRIVLPSEAHWERAARGKQARRWPWGDEWQAGLANTNEAGLQETSAVGLFPQGASPEGVREMAGNVWEWSSSRWGQDLGKPEFGYPYDHSDGREDVHTTDHGVVRGGSWYYPQRNARCAVRLSLIPDNDGDLLGFRVVVVSLVDSES